MDAAGSLGCFYRAFHGVRHAEVWASSSAALLASAIPRAPAIVRAPPIAHGRGMDWYPPPRSRVAGIHRLLVSQVLALRHDRPIVRWRPLAPGLAPSTDHDRTLDALQATLVTAMRSIASRHGEVWLPLTAGFDSRLLLAALHGAGVQAQTFTQARPFPTMSRGDRTLPPRLAARVGFSHRLIEPRSRRTHPLSVFDDHTGGHSVDQDRYFYARGQWDDVPASAVVLRGGGFEIARAHFYSRFPTSETADIAATLAHGFRFSDFHRASYVHPAGVADWLMWMHEHPEALDWRDRLYFEQRVAGWLSATEQALDLLEPEMLNPAICQRYLVTALGLPADVRRRGGHQADLIRLMAPELLDEPFNPADGPTTRGARKVRLRSQNVRGRLTSWARRMAEG